jgi:DNA-binding transcriptional LysR family regulator
MDRNLIAFVMIAETKNMTEASRRLNVTQPTLTKRLQQLERIYRCQLVDRLARGVQLTQFGEELLPFAKRIEQTHLQAQEALGAVQDGHLDEIRVGAGPLFHLKYLGPAFLKLQQEFPETRIRLSTDLNDRNIPKIRDGGLELAFGTTEHLGDNEEIKFLALTEVEQGILVSKNSELAGLDSVQPEHLDHLDWIVYSEVPENEELALGYLSSHGLSPPNIVLQTTSFSMGIQMVAKSELAMTLPIQLASHLPSDDVRAIRTIPPIASKAAGVFYRPSTLLIPVVSRLISLVQLQISQD